MPTGTGAVTCCVTPFCVGDDLSGLVGAGTNLAMGLKRKVPSAGAVFLRAGARHPELALEHLLQLGR